MRRRRRGNAETSEVALMAVMTKAMGAFLILMVFGLRYYMPDFTADEIAQIVKSSMGETRERLNELKKDIRIGDFTKEEVAALQEKLDFALAGLAKAESEVARLQSRLDEANSQLQRLVQEKAALEQKVAALEAEIARLRANDPAKLLARIKELEAQLASTQAELAQARSDIARLTQELDKLRALVAEVDALREKLKQAEIQNEMLRQQNDKLTVENEALKKRIAELEAEVARLRANDPTQLLAQIRALQAQLAAAQAETERLREEVETLKPVAAAALALQKENAALTEEIERLRAMSSGARIVSFVARYSDCVDAGIQLYVGRLEQKDAAKPYPAAVRGPQTPGLQSETIFNTFGTRREDPSIFMWRADAGVGETLTLFAKRLVSLKGDDQVCNLAIDVLDRNVLSARATLPPDAPFRFIGAYRVEENGIALVTMQADRLAELQSALDRADCRALSCDPGRTDLRAALDALLTKRFGNLLLSPPDITADEKARLGPVRQAISDAAATGKADVKAIARWVRLLVSTGRSPPGADAAAAADKGRADLVAAGIPQAIADEFQRRSLAGFWPAASIPARVTAALTEAPSQPAPSTPGTQNRPAVDPTAFLKSAQDQVDASRASGAIGPATAEALAAVLKGALAPPGPGRPNPADIADLERRLAAIPLAPGLVRFLVAGLAQGRIPQAALRDILADPKR